MNNHVKLRLVLLTLGIALMGVTIGGLTAKSQRQAGKLRAQLVQVDSESFRIAGQFTDSVRLLNLALYRFGTDHATNDLASFSKASADLNRWIDEQKPKLMSSKERALMQQIDTTYDAYLRAARHLIGQLEKLGQQSATVSDYMTLMQESQKLADLGRDLALAHFNSRAVLLNEANQTVAEWRGLVLISLGGLFVFGAALAYGVYRHMIAPLRLKLVQNETLLERKEKLASLGMLAAGVAHEIRNPLTAIKAALFMQQKQFKPGSQEFADAQLVEREILRLERIVNDFLLFARPTEPKFALVDAGTALQEVNRLLAPQLARKNIELMVEPAPSLQFKADAAQIKQVLINLVQNAADAIDREGVIKLRARPDRKRLPNVSGEVVILEVADNGKGIPLEVQERLFDPFFTTKDSGTGLGLSIAAGIVEKHGGALQYQTQVNHGTTFGVILPRSTS
jgi:signal transduction histidine kinase